MSDEASWTLLPNGLTLWDLDCLAVELRELHDDTGISLDKWSTARKFVEAFTGPITENGV